MAENFLSNLIHDFGSRFRIWTKIENGIPGRKFFVGFVEEKRRQKEGRKEEGAEWWKLMDWLIRFTTKNDTERHQCNGNYEPGVVAMLLEFVDGCVADVLTGAHALPIHSSRSDIGGLKMSVWVTQWASLTSFRPLLLPPMSFSSLRVARKAMPLPETASSSMILPPRKIDVLLPRICPWLKISGEQWSCWGSDDSLCLNHKKFIDYCSVLIKWHNAGCPI